MGQKLHDSPGLTRQVLHEDGAMSENELIRTLETFKSIHFPKSKLLLKAYYMIDKSTQKD